MFQLSPIVTLAALGLVQQSFAQYPPYVTYDKVLQSPINSNITISYKKPQPGTCTTVFENQTQYTGYINLPPFTLEPYQQDYPINTFFWFFESRVDPQTAPLTIWLNGGPGSSSMYGLFVENGPCEVVQFSDGSYGTQSSPWGWDRSSNVLYIDQPTQVGFSYDVLKNQSVSLPYAGSSPYAFSDPKPLPSGVPSWAFLNGTFSSRYENSTQNTSMIAASAAWHFLQGFLSAFPDYNPGTRPNSTTVEPTGINLFTESYGGVYGPAFADYFEQQNAKRLSGNFASNETLEIKLKSLGIVNGLVDTSIQAPSWPRFAYNNTYGLQVIDQTTELNTLSSINNSDSGCKAQIAKCRDSAKKNDPTAEGDVASTNSLCESALRECNQALETSISDRSPYDVRTTAPSSFSDAYLEYLNNADVQRSIGAKVNFTQGSDIVQGEFIDTGDQVRGTAISSLASLLSLGVQVALIYGDADIICNWYGGELVSLELARLTPSYATPFPAAGYADIVVNSSYVGGMVRQYGNLSFSRIYDAGHMVPASQPETAFTVFTRIIQGNDIGMGHEEDLSKFSTTGPSVSDHKNKVPQQQEQVCWIRDVFMTCNDDDISAIQKGQGVVQNGKWYADESEITPTSSSVDAGRPGTLPTNEPTPVGTGTATALTGVYTASTTPKPPSSGASSLRSQFRLMGRQSFFPDENDPLEKNADEQEERANSFKKALTIATAVLGSLLLLSLIGSLVLCCCLLRPRRTTLEPETEKAAPKKPNLVQRFARQPTQTVTTIDPVPGNEHEPPHRREFIERVLRRPSVSPVPEVHPLDSAPRRNIVVHRMIRRSNRPYFPDVPSSTPGVLAAPVVVERMAVRRPSVPMEPIPEVDSIKGASPVTSHRSSTEIGDPANLRRISTHPNEPIFVQRNAGTGDEPEASKEPTPVPSRRSTEKAEPVPSRKASEAPRAPTPIPSRRPSEVPQEATPSTPEPVMKRAATQPPEPSPQTVPGSEKEPVATLRRPTTVPSQPENPSAPKRTMTGRINEKIEGPPSRVGTAPPPPRSRAPTLLERPGREPKVETRE